MLVEPRMGLVLVLLLAAHTTLVTGTLTLSPSADAPAGVVISGTIVRLAEDVTNSASSTSPITLAEISSDVPGEVRIASMNPDGITLTLNSDGKFTLGQPLDHDDVRFCPSLRGDGSCRISVVVLEPDGATTTIFVDITDVNDNSPMLDTESCKTVEVPENTPGGRCEFKATDLDRWVDGNKLQFSLQDEVGGLFSVNPASGMLEVDVLDFETTTIYQLTVIVKDTAGNEDELNFFVTVTDQPDQPPIWSSNIPLQLTIQEDTPLNSEILKVSAVDGDRNVNSPITITLDVQDGDGYFACTPTGSITVTAPLDTSVMSQVTFQATVTATEDDPPNDRISATISITVSDVDNKPVEVVQPPSQLTIDIPETFSGGIPTATFTVRDDDTVYQNNKYTARLVGTDLPANFQQAITLSPASGTESNGETEYTLTVNPGHIDFDDDLGEWRRALITFQVEIEGAQNTERVYFELTVQNVNDEVPIWADGVSEIVISKEENQPLDVLYTLEATDKDFGSEFGQASLRYGFDTRKPSYLEINDVSGEMSVVSENNLDYEFATVDAFRVKVWDNFQDPSDQNVAYLDFTITVIDVNDEKPTIRLSASRVDDVVEEATGLPLPLSVTVTVNDADADKSLKCSLSVNDSPGPEVDNWFAIDPDTCAISIVNVIDREYPVGAVTDRVELTITVEDVAADPKYPDQIDTSVLIVQINDINDNTPEFDIDTSGLYILETGNPDLETDSQRKVLDLLATDKDSNTDFTFAIEENPGDAFELDVVGSVRNGRNVLRRKKDGEVDREATPTITIKVSVSDGLNKEETDLVVQVGDRNDEAPIWTPDPPTTVSVTENDNCPDPPDDELLTAHAEDRDDCTEFTRYGCINYAIELNQPGYSHFQIGLEDGILKTQGCSIDRETLSEYKLVIYAYDDYRTSGPQIGNNQLQWTVTVIVEDVNDNAPVLTPTPQATPEVIWQIDEDVAAGEALDRIQVSDADDGDNKLVDSEITRIIWYRKSVEVKTWSGNDPEKPFSLVPSPDGYSLQLRTADNYNFTDDYGLFDVEILSQDRGTPSLSTSGTYRIVVKDVNHNDPIMDWPELDGQIFIVEEGQRPPRPVEALDGTVLSPLTATDKDDPDESGNGLISYAFVDPSDDVTEYLKLDPVTGDLTWNNVWLWTETGAKELVVVVQASDGGSPPRKSTTLTFRLRVKPINKTPPVFDDLTAELSYDENQVGVVGEFPEAQDADIIPGLEEEDMDRIYYHVVGADEEALEYFEVANSESASLSVKKELDREGRDAYEVVILASNYPDSPGLLDPIPNNRSILRINFQVGDVNDEPPRFGKSLVSAGISNRFTTTETILLASDVLNATDLDLGDSIRYRISTPVSRSDPTLESVREEAFILEDLGVGGATLRIDFVPQPVMKGFFSFNISAYDAEYDTTPEGHMGSTTCKLYIVTDEHFVQFFFNNNSVAVEAQKERIRDILSRAYGFPCSINSVEQTQDESSGSGILDSTTVTAHFVNSNEEEPLRKVVIEDWQYSHPLEFQQLITDLRTALNLNIDVEGGRIENSVDSQQVVIYVLVAVSAVLFALLLILGTSCFFKNRGMERKLRAYSASTQNGMAGDMKDVVPNTNKMDINPILIDGSDEKKIPAFDELSVTSSGGSSLIAVEEQDDFKGYQERENPAFEDDLELNSSGDEENVYGSVRNPAYDSHYQMQSEYDYPTGLSPPPPEMDSRAEDLNPIGTVSRKNPLASIGLDGAGDY